MDSNGMAGRGDPSRLNTLLRDPYRAARRAGLRYEGDGAPGWTRRKRGDGFAYFDASGRQIQRPRDISRVNARHSTRLDARLDQPVTRRSHSGHRARRPRAQTVQVPQPLS